MRFEVASDTTARACRAAIWLGLVEAQRAGWPDVVASLYAVHAQVVERVHDAERGQWRARLHDEGPNQCDSCEP